MNRSERREARTRAAAQGHILSDFRVLPDGSGDQVAECVRCGRGAALDASPAATENERLTGAALYERCGPRFVRPGPNPDAAAEERRRAASDALADVDHRGFGEADEPGERRALQRAVDEEQRKLSRDGSAWLKANGFTASGAKRKKH